jgi:hypothetical protein
LEATLVPLCGRWLLFVRAAVRRALASGSRPRVSSDLPTALCGSPIGTAMLSYAEHGKFHNSTQAPAPSFPPRKREEQRTREKRRCLAPIFANVPLHQVDHGTRFYAMVHVGSLGGLRWVFVHQTHLVPAAAAQPGRRLAIIAIQPGNRARSPLLRIDLARGPEP